MMGRQEQFQGSRRGPSIVMEKSCADIGDAAIIKAGLSSVGDEEKISHSKQACSARSTKVWHQDKKKNRKSKRNGRYLPHDAKIGIVGGGIGGFGCALALKNAGFTNIVVFERDSNFNQRRDGYGLTLTYNPRGPLAQLGILEEVATLDIPSRSHYIFSADGSVLGYFGNAFSAGRGLGQRGNLRVPRQKVRKVMLDKLLNEEAAGSTPSILWGKRLTHFVDPCLDDLCAIRPLENSSAKMTDQRVSLYFEDNTTDEVDLLIGADGVRSTVRSQMSSMTDSRPKNNNYDAQLSDDGLKYLGIMIIIGITSDFHHPLLDERGFYTVDGEHRLFTMPYEGSYVDDDERLGERKAGNRDDSREIVRKTMWQLSFRLKDELEAKRLSKSGSQALLSEALRRCSAWHSPVCDMFLSTPIETMWGTGLMDRKPQAFHAKQIQSRAVVLGDAMHSMSPFKGQGANQALADGPLLASWLKKASLYSAIRSFERQMVTRTMVKVEASREAAECLHSPEVMQQCQAFAGVRKDSVRQFVQELKQRNISADLGAQLDVAVRKVILDIGVGENSVAPEMLHRSINRVDEDVVLGFAGEGDLVGLRNFCIRHDPECIRSARCQSTGETCLHLAAKKGHYDVCKWLISEAQVSTVVLDKNQESPLHAAFKGKDDRITKLVLSALSRWGN